LPKTLINETSEQYFTSLHDEKKFTNNTIMNVKCVTGWVYRTKFLPYNWPQTYMLTTDSLL